MSGLELILCVIDLYAFLNFVFNSNFSAGQIMLRCDMPGEDVLPFYQKAVQLDPSNSNALRELASVYYDLGQKNKSISVFKDAIQNEDAVADLEEDEIDNNENDNTTSTIVNID